MELEQWLAHAPSVARLAEGRETEWLDVATVELASLTLALGDPARFPLGSVVVGGLRPDPYEVQVRVMALGARRVIARLRAFRATTCPPGERGSLLGTARVESGRLGVGDWERLADATDALTLEEQAAAGALEPGGLAGVARFAPEAAMPFVVVGAGEFGVHELGAGDRRTGCEVVFLPHAGR